MIYVDFNRYGLEVKTWGSNGQEFDLHVKTSSGEFHIDFDLSSYSSSLSLSRMCGSGYMTNVPVPSTSTRIWKFSKNAYNFYIHCDGRLVASIPRSSLSCLNNYDWQTLGSIHGVYFHSTDAVSKYYRLSGNTCKFN